MPVIKKINAVAIIRWCLGSVFFLSGLLKLSDLHAFALLLEKFKIVPMGWGGVLSYLVPSFEMILGIFLILNLFSYISALVSFEVLILFFFILATEWLTGSQLETCGCLGPKIKLSLSQSLIKTGVLMLFSGGLLYSTSRKK